MITEVALSSVTLPLTHASSDAKVLIGRLWTKLVWAGASVGRSDAATQAIAAIEVAPWDQTRAWTVDRTVKTCRAALSATEPLDALGRDRRAALL